MSQFNNLVAGEWIGAASYMANINPSNTNEIVGEYAQANNADVDAAIEAASAAFFTWSRAGIQQRSDSLDAIGSEVLSRKEELGRLLAREEGKSLPESIGEVTRAGHIFKFFGGEVLRQVGDHIASVRPGIEIDVTREPIGVVAIITPWNFPIAIPAWKIAPALAFGNCVVFKPANLVTGCAWALAEIIHRHLPPGVFNLVMGSGSVVGNQLLEDSRVRGVSFTGSVATGSTVAATCSRRGAKFQLEMGGKNPLIVLDDADLNTAVACAINGAYYSTGQRCTASSRLIVQSGIHDAFVEAVVSRLKTLRIDDPLKEDTDIGPVVDQSQLDQDLDYLRIGREEGAELIHGGELIERDNPGYFLSPALFVGTKNEMRVNREEIFGPVATVIKAGDFEEALAIANDTEFGLSAGICTKSLGSASKFKRESQAGMVMVNLPTAGVDYHVPFGGTKGSSFGSREQGSYAAEFYTTVKTAYTLPQ
ncbi:MAG: acyl-CoA reductase-like NAD-dependent aldehyde dehydrogenase [Candidatus Azotimanducaceae bacterium]|jgi:aldehyde dehydrogenase (NAD+)